MGLDNDGIRFVGLLLVLHGAAKGLGLRPGDGRPAQERLNGFAHVIPCVVVLPVGVVRDGTAVGENALLIYDKHVRRCLGGVHVSDVTFGIQENRIRELLGFAPFLDALDLVRAEMGGVDGHPDDGFTLEFFQRVSHQIGFVASVDYGTFVVGPFQNDDLSLGVAEAIRLTGRNLSV